MNEGREAMAKLAFTFFGWLRSCAIATTRSSRSVRLIGGVLAAHLVAIPLGEAQSTGAECVYPEIHKEVLSSIDHFGGVNHMKVVRVYVRVLGSKANVNDLIKQLQGLGSTEHPVWFVDSVEARVDGDSIVDEFRTTKEGAFIVVDGEFMTGGVPKYNEILSTYKDTALHEKTTVFLDPFLDVIDKQPIFVQLVPGLNVTNLAYRIEGIALLMRYPKLLIAKDFTRYLGELPEEQIADEKRKQIIVDCVHQALNDGLK
jgi:hypothetical protein